MKQCFLVLLLVSAVFCWQACTTGRQMHSASGRNGVGAFVQDSLLARPELAGAQVGICIYDPATAGYLYNFQGDKYFVPASNTKLFSLFAGLKYLGDSLVGIRYRTTDTALLVLPAGDPTFLHPAYAVQPVMDLMRKV